MSRTTMEIPMKTNRVDEVLHIIASTLESAGYNKKIVDGETVWAKGDGVIVKMQCASATFTANSVVMQGWMKDAITGESSLDGFVAIIPKKKFRGVLDSIRTAIITKGL